MVNLIPMAGLGSRFSEEMYRVPKPFIPVLGEPMFMTSYRAMPAADRSIFLCRQEHVARYKIPELVRSLSPDPLIIPVSTATQGQACTCLLAEPNLDPGEGLFIASCDYQTLYNHDRYQKLLDDPSVDVIIWTFRIGNIKKANPNAFAYCCLDKNRVIEVVEKKTISDNPQHDPAVVGSFTYKRSELFLHGAKQMIKNDVRVNGEFYVATSINQLIEEGYHVVPFEVDQYISFGNPFELMTVNYWQEYFAHLEDFQNATHDRYNLRRVP